MTIIQRKRSGRVTTGSITMKKYLIAIGAAATYVVSYAVTLAADLSSSTIITNAGTGVTEAKATLGGVIDQVWPYALIVALFWLGLRYFKSFTGLGVGPRGRRRR